MEAKLESEIAKLPVIMKAHIYEPRVEDVAEISFKAGIKYAMDSLLVVEDGKQDFKAGEEQGRQEERRRIVNCLKREKAVWVDKNYSLIEAIKRGIDNG